MVHVLADGKVKLSLLTTKPANPAAPTLTELNAGIDISCKVLSDNFDFGPTDSDKNNEKVLCSTGNSNSLGASNYQAGFTLLREFLVAGGFDATGDAAFVALKSKGATVWLYARQTDKLATTDWAAAEEIFFGCAAISDNPQYVAGSGGIKYKIPLEVQFGYPFITVAAGA